MEHGEVVQKNNKSEATAVNCASDMGWMTSNLTSYVSMF